MIGKDANKTAVFILKEKRVVADNLTQFTVCQYQMQPLLPMNIIGLGRTIFCVDDQLRTQLHCFSGDEIRYSYRIAIQRCLPEIIDRHTLG